MKRLKYIHTDELVTGIVIESYGKTGYAMRYYRMNENHEILTVDHLTVFLDMGEIVDILSQDTLVKRVRRLHYYFKEAEYISADIIDALNDYREDNDVFEELKDVITF